MKAIIIAAGSGKRISKDVKEIPKSMVQVNGRPIINYQISVLKQVGINEIIVITGPYSNHFNLTDVVYVKDVNYMNHDILGSLMEAKDYLKEDVIIMYSDIIFEIEILKKIVNSTRDISIAIDMNWMKNYVGRTLHPIEEAENVEINNLKKIIRIKKNIKGKNENIGEFLGLMKLSKKGSQMFVETFQNSKNRKGVFHEASSIQKAYLTDIIQEMIDLGIEIEPVFITGKWCEIDTIQDLKNAEKIFH